MFETIHDYDARLKTALRNLDKSEKICQENKKLILGYLNSCMLENLSKARAIKYTYYLMRLSEWVGISWEKAKREHIEKIVLNINQSNYAEQSKKEYKTCIKKFYKWMLKSDDYPDIVRWIKPHSRRIAKVRLPEEILEKKEILSMVRQAITIRDKAFIACLWESGCRIGEYLFLRIKHVRPASTHGLQIMVDGKTGPRRILLVEMAPYLKEWINSHPRNNDPEAYVWITRNGTLVKYQTMRAFLVMIARRAGIKKTANPHAFRHSRATYVANHMTESQMKMFFGWAQASDMAQIYVHLSGRDVDNAVLKMNGIEIKDGENEENKGPKKCIQCGQMNSPIAKFCSTCGAVLDAQIANDIIRKDLERRETEIKLEKLLEDPEFKEMFLRKIGSMKK